MTKDQAQKELETALGPGYPVKAWTIFQDFYLFRVEHPYPAEKDWDPFFTVDKLTGEVRDFPILEIPSFEHRALEWKEV